MWPILRFCRANKGMSSPPGPTRPDEFRTPPPQRHPAPQGRDTFSYVRKGQPPEKTTLEALLGSDAIFRTIHQLLNEAEALKLPVWADWYSLEPPRENGEKGLTPDSLPETFATRIQKQLVERLVRLKAQGNEVRIVLDAHRESAKRGIPNQAALDALRKGGVDVQTYPDWAAINHVKLLGVGNKALIGGMNLSQHSPHNHDAAVLIDGADAKRLYNDVFREDWLASGGNPQGVPKAPVPPSRVVATAVTVPKHAARSEAVPKIVPGRAEIREQLLNAIRQTRREIVAEVFVLTHVDVVDELLKAHRRLKAKGQPGVRLLVDPGLCLQFPACKKQVDRLAAQGVPLV